MIAPLRVLFSSAFRPFLALCARRAVADLPALRALRRPVPSRPRAGTSG